MQIQVTGLDRVGVLLNQLPPKLRVKVQTNLKNVAAEIRDLAQNYVPVDTGSLKKSIRIQNYSRPAGYIEKLGVRAGGYIVNPKTGALVNYACHVEFGTSRGYAQPYMRPAFQNKRGDIVKVMRQAALEACHV